MALTQYSSRRIVVVTLGLSATGAVLGGIAGAGALSVALLFTDRLQVFRELDLLIIPAMIGALLGSVCAPLAGWLLLRRVPLGRAFGGLVLGTVAGGLLGWFSPISFNFMIQPILTAAIGFLVAALFMRRHPSPHQHTPAEIGDGAT
jgi:lysylphosphatidylglycerol synthetase-like protein (DUF2156 family)